MRLGEFSFDRQSGELRGPNGETRRLPPQPAALLARLVDNLGQLVTREELREALWPEVVVDFDNSLHHCVRQVRSALEDSAKNPRFIETIPRRGYRLRTEHVQVDEPAEPPAPPPRRNSTADASTRPARYRVMVGVVAAVVLALIAATGLSAAEHPSGHGPRIAIMSFDNGSQPSPRAEQITERVLVSLTHRRPHAAIVGPRTTEPLRHGGQSLRSISTTLRVDHILNAKHIEADRSLLVELIRTDDGKHVWVKRYANLGDWETIADEITQAVATTVP